MSAMIARPGPGKVLTAVGVGPIVVVDQYNTETFVTNLLTRQVKSLEGPWLLQTDEEGLVAVLTNQHTDEVRDLDEVLNLQVVQRAGDPTLLVYDSQKGGKSVRPLDELRTAFKQVKATLQVACGGRSCTFHVSMFKMPRACEVRCFWWLKDVYGFMKLKSYGNASTWMDTLLPRWQEKVFAKILAGEHVCWGSYFHPGLKVRAKMPWHLRCMPATGISTPALILLLCRWIALPAEAGGLTQPGPRGAANEMLGGILKCFEDPTLSERTFHIAVEENWSCPWPRPSVVHAGICMPFEVASGIINMGPLLAASTRSYRSNP